VLTSGQIVVAKHEGDFDVNLTLFFQHYYLCRHSTERLARMAKEPPLKISPPVGHGRTQVGPLRGRGGLGMKGTGI